MGLLNMEVGVMELESGVFVRCCGFCVGKDGGG